jgi:hypothetical protein
LRASNTCWWRTAARSACCCSRTEQGVEPRKYEGGWDSSKGRCHDCGAKVGHYHHPGCDLERCPVCGQQALFCDHLEGCAKMFARKSNGLRSSSAGKDSLAMF